MMDLNNNNNGLLLGWHALWYTKISKTSLSLAEGGLAGKYETWVGTALGDHQLEASAKSLRREGKIMLLYESAPIQFPGGGGV